MNVYLAGENGKKNIIQNSVLYGIDVSQINILESYYYLRKNTDFPKYITHFNSFLLDSGCFTFMTGKHGGKVNWDAYTNEYAEFINKWDIKLFVEMDLDFVEGIEKTEYLRARLEALTGKKPIPVWHRTRSKEYFIEMCKNYPYVAYGGLMTDGISLKTAETSFPWFISTAHQYGAKIHGLGYTSIEGLHRYKFDSVDSTAWLIGNRAGFLWRFNPYTGLMEKIDKPANCRLKSRSVALHNLKEWVKFNQYAMQYL